MVSRRLLSIPRNHIRVTCVTLQKQSAATVSAPLAFSFGSNERYISLITRSIPVCIDSAGQCRVTGETMLRHCGLDKWYIGEATEEDDDQLRSRHIDT